MRGASVNRQIRSRALVSAVLFAFYAAGAGALGRAGFDNDTAVQVHFVQLVALIFGLVNLSVTAAINPWRTDRLPDRFPTIVQDALIIVFFAVAATIVLRGQFLATTAVGAVVVGLALQDTLGNLFAGLAIQIEKPFHVGHWVGIGGRDGVVTAVTWRATKIRTKAGKLVVVPNSVIARETVSNYSEPTGSYRLEVEIGVSYDAQPNEVKTAIQAALRDEPLIDRTHAVEVLLVDFAASSVVYRVRVWATDFAADERLRDSVRTRIYYAFRRHGIGIPYPVQVQLEGQPAARPDRPETGTLARTLGATSIFSALSADELAALVQASEVLVFGDGEAIVTEGEAGSSMFVLRRGTAKVQVAGSKEELARLGPGDFFGEMSLLTGAARTASVVALGDSELVEITAENFRRVAQHDPSIMDRIAETMASRRIELDKHRAGIVWDAPAADAASTFLAKVRRFLRLSVASS